MEIVFFSSLFRPFDAANFVPRSVLLSFFFSLSLSLDTEVEPIRRFEALHELIDVIVTDQFEST